MEGREGKREEVGPWEKEQIQLRLQAEQLPRQRMGTRDSGRKVALLDQRGTREERARDAQENVILQLLPPSWLCRGSTKLHLLAANGSGSRVQVGGWGARGLRSAQCPPLSGSAQLSSQAPAAKRKLMVHSVTVPLAPEGPLGFTVPLPLRPRDYCILFQEQPPPTRSCHCLFATSSPFLSQLGSREP